MSTAVAAPMAPSPPGLPLIGHAWDMLRRPGDFLLETTRSHGPSIAIHVGPIHTLVVSSPPAVREVLVDRADQFQRGYKELRLAFGDGLLTADGERWRGPRKLMNPAFKNDSIAGLEHIIVKLTAEMLDQWEGKARRGETVDAHVDLTHLGFRIAGVALFGVDLKEESVILCEAASELMRTLWAFSTRAVPLPLWLPTPLHRSLRRCLGAIDGVVRRATTNRDISAECPRLTSCLMHGQLDSGRSLDEREIRDQAVTLLLAGHETTANGLAWALALLAERAADAEQLRALIGNGDDVASAAVRNVPEVRYAVCEAMRLFPPVWVFERLAAMDTNIGGYGVPAGWFVAVCPWILHRDASVWANPTEFIPSRFAPEEAKKRDRHAFVPFGAGARQCIGMHFAMVEMQIVLAMILKRFRFRLAQGARLEPEFTITLRPRHGVPLELEACT